MHHFPVKTMLVVGLFALMFFVPIATREYEECGDEPPVTRFHILRGQKDDFDNTVYTPTGSLVCNPSTHKAQLFIL